MPNYNFRNKETNEEFTEFMTMGAREEFLAANPHIEQIPSLTAIADPTRLGLRKPDGAFRDILKNVKKMHHRSTVNTF